MTESAHLGDQKRRYGSPFFNSPERLETSAIKLKTERKNARSSMQEEKKNPPQLSVASSKYTGSKFKMNHKMNIPQLPTHLFCIIKLKLSLQKERKLH